MPKPAETAAKVIEAYEKLNDLVDHLITDTSSIPTRMEVTANGELRENSSLDWLPKRKISIDREMGFVYFGQRNSKEAAQLSQKHYRRARELLVKLGKPEDHQKDLIDVAWHESRAAGRAGDVRGMEEALQFLKTVENKWQPTSFFVGEAFQNFLTKPVRTIRSMAWTRR